MRKMRIQVDTAKKRTPFEMRRLQKSILGYAKTRPQWTNKNGYVVISIQKKKRKLFREKGDWFYRYRFVLVSHPVHFHVWFMEQMLGRKMEKGEDVHHKNEIKTDNRFRNLEVLTRSKHISLHRKLATDRSADSWMKAIKRLR